MMRGLIVLLTTLGALFVATTCAAEPIRLVIAVGHRNGLAADPPLKHSAQDATRV